MLANTPPLRIMPLFQIFLDNPTHLCYNKMCDTGTAPIRKNGDHNICKIEYKGGDTHRKKRDCS